VVNFFFPSFKKKSVNKKNIFYLVCNFLGTEIQKLVRKKGRQILLGKRKSVRKGNQGELLLKGNTMFN